jgi:hypothetical protein
MSNLEQGFSTGVPRNTSVPRRHFKCSARACLKNEIYTILEIFLKHEIGIIQFKSGKTVSISDDFNIGNKLHLLHCFL